MNLLKKTSLCILLASSIQTLSAGNSLAIFADEHDPENRILTVDYKNMELIDAQDVEGSLNHHADVIGTVANPKYIMMVPKASTFVTFRNVEDRSFVKKLDLPFNPRSGDAFNSKHNLTLLTASNRPAAVLIDNLNLNVVGKAGFNIACNKERLSDIITTSEIETQTCTAPDFGGGQISGHPIWLDSETFAILDRANRYVHIYGIRFSTDGWDTSLKTSIQTDTSLHQIIPDPRNKRVFYGMTEGNFNTGKLARIYKFSYTHGNLKITDNVKLSYTSRDYSWFSFFAKKKSYKGIGGHNLYITPNNQYLYGATATGDIFVVKTRNLKIKNAFKAGKGAGHVNFMKNGSYGAVTNHKDNFVTIFNWKTHKFVKNIRTDFDKEGIASLLHSHSPYIEGKYFYNFWTDGGVLYRINLNTLRLDASVYVGGVPIQGSYYNFSNDDDSNTDMIVTNKKRYSRYEKITVNFNDMSDNRRNWIGIYPADAKSNWYNLRKWKWTYGRENGKSSFYGLARGNYEVRAFFNNSYEAEATYSFSVE